MDRRPARDRLLLLAVIVLFAASCTSLRLASLDPFPAGQALVGPEGSYELVPPAEFWVRTEGNESRTNIDLALARKSNDAWLTASVVEGRYPTVEAAFERARARAEAMMNVVSRSERDVVVASPAGELPARLGEYCGSFDRELRSRDSCFVILVSQLGRTTYALVGQLRLKDEAPDRKDELTVFVTSLRITSSK